MLRAYQRYRSWLALPRTPELLVVAAFVQLCAYLVDHQIRSFPDSRAYLQAAHAWFDPSARVPIRRYQQNLFSIIWAPLVRAHDSGQLLIIEAIVLLLLAVLVFYRGLLRMHVSARAAWWAALAASCLPPTLYFERIVMSESLAYDEVLVWVFLVAWATFPWRAWRVLVVAAYTLFIAGTTRSAFLQFFLAVVLVVAVVAIVDARRHRRFNWRAFAAGTAALAIGGGAGMLGASALQGVASDVGPLTAMRNSSSISGFMLASKYAGLVTCDPPLSQVRQAICDAGPGVNTTDAADLVFWYTAMTPEWNDTPASQFAQFGREYKSLAISSIVNNPFGAAKIALRDGAHMLLPVQSYRYTSDDVTPAALPSVAPWMTLRSPATWPADDDLPYRASAATDVVRFFAVIALFVIVIRRLRARQFGPGIVFAGIWALSFLALATTAYPTERYLMPLDPILVAAVALLFAGDESRAGEVVGRG